MKKFFKKIYLFFINFFKKKEKPKYIPIDNLEELNKDERVIFRLINAHRVKLGVNPLVSDKLLTYVAKNRNFDNIFLGRITHDGNHKTFEVLYRQNLKVTENLGFLYTKPESVVASWIKSDAHRFHLENPIWEMTGIKISIDIITGKKYYCQIFSKAL